MTLGSTLSEALATFSACEDASVRCYDEGRARRGLGKTKSDDEGGEVLTSSHDEGLCEGGIGYGRWEYLLMRVVGGRWMVQMVLWGKKEEEGRDEAYFDWARRENEGPQSPAGRSRTLSLIGRETTTQRSRLSLVSWRV